MKADLAVIFDMDGVLVNNFAWHLKAWEKFCKKHKKRISADEFREHVFGGNNPDHLKFIFGNHLSHELINKYGQEKELIYRELYKGNIQPVAGLKAFLSEIKEIGIPTAIATSAERANVDFILEAIGLSEHFNVIVDSSMIKKGKPDPEVFTKAASLLNTEPQKCIVFEDSLKGIAAALNARMKVIGVGTTHYVAELTEAHLVINDFTEISADRLTILINQPNY